MLKINYKKAYLLYTIVLKVEQALYPEYSRGYNYHNLFVEKLRTFILTAKGYEDCLELNNKELKKSAKIIEALPNYTTTDEEVLATIISLISRIKCGED